MFVPNVTVKERPMIQVVGSHVYVICVMDMAVFVKISPLKKRSKAKKWEFCRRYIHNPSRDVILF